MLSRGYDRDERIIYASGKVIDMTNIEEETNHLFEAFNLAFTQVRSPTNNCYHFHLER